VLGRDKPWLRLVKFGMGFLQLSTWHVNLVRDLAIVGLSPLGRNLLQAVPSLELHRTNVGSAFIKHAPALTLQQPYDRVFGELTPGEQGPRAFREFAAACCTAYGLDASFAMLLFSRTTRSLSFCLSVSFIG
jgi:hypothetical protein